MSIERSEAAAHPSRWIRVLLVGLLAVAPWGFLAPAPAAAADCTKTGEVTDLEVTQVSWAQRRIQPERVWPLTTGQGVTVAVIDSGIDSTRPNWPVKSRPADFLGAPGGPSTADCKNQGTKIAGVIAAKPLPKAPMTGVAPGARLLSVRQSELDGDKTRGTPATLAQAIGEAVAGGAQVINVSASWNTDDAQLRDAVASALKSNVVVVAAAGNEDPTLRPDQAAKAKYWPASYDGVLSVAASDEEDKRADKAHAGGSYVDVAAPGQEVLTTGANGPRSYAEVSGARIATAFVSGTAALVRAYHPRLTALQVAARIKATADVPPQGVTTSGLGAGIVNPLLAVTAIIPVEGSAATEPPVAPLVAVPALPVPRDHSVRNRALAASAAIAAIALLVTVAGVVLPRGRERRWRPRRPTSAPGS